MHPPPRSYADSEGVIFCVLAATKFWTLGLPMTWNRRYQVKSYIRSSLWIIPFVALLLEQVVGTLASALDAHLAWKGLGFGVDGAQALLNATIR